MWSTRSSSKELSFKLIRAETMGQGVSSKKRQCPTYQTYQLVGQANEVDLIVGDTHCTALLDTGSMVSTISADTCRNMNLEIQPLDEIIQLESAGGHKLSSLGLVQIDISIPKSASTDDLVNSEQKHIPITERPPSKKLPAVFLVVPHTTYHNRVPVFMELTFLDLEIIILVFWICSCSKGNLFLTYAMHPKEFCCHGYKFIYLMIIVKQ